MTDIKFEYIKNLEAIPLENIVAATIMYGSNSKYGIMMNDAETFLKENLSPAIYYDRDNQKVIVTSEEFMNRKFH